MIMTNLFGYTLRSGWKKTVGVEITVEHCNLDLYENAKKYPEDPERFHEKTIPIYEPGTLIRDNYGFITKIGSGGFSLIWLVVDFKSKDFKAMKLFIYGHEFNNEEYTIHQILKEKAPKHPNIMRFYDSIRWHDSIPEAYGAVYEPLGKNLKMLMNETEKYGGLSNGVIKIIAKNILNALVTLHNDCKFIHSDIKPENIAACTSQKYFFDQVEAIRKSSKSLKPLRMTCKQKQISEEKAQKRRQRFKEFMDVLQISQTNDKTNKLNFKLIDFDNALEEGIRARTGTYGFHPPEYFFGAKITYSYDVWSLGVTLIQLFTGRNFIASRFYIDDQSEVNELKRIFGFFPREWYSYIEKPYQFFPIFTRNNRSAFENRFKKELRRRTQYREMFDEEREKVNDFLFKMLHPNPSKRMSAADLLKLPWLNDENVC